MERLLLIACASVAWMAVVACGCSSGAAGPASPSFDPFGIDPASPTGAEPTISGTDMPPSQGRQQSIAVLCATDCARIEGMCPGTEGPDCASSCSASAAMTPGCDAQIRAFLSCVAGATVICAAGGIQVPVCNGAITAVSTCLNQGSGGAFTQM
jgi:hypothetical protein